MRLWLWLDYTGFQLVLFISTVSPVEITASVPCAAIGSLTYVTILQLKVEATETGNLIGNRVKKEKVDSEDNTDSTLPTSSTSLQKVTPPFKIWFV